MTTISLDHVRTVARRPSPSTFTVSTTDREVTPEVRLVVAAVIAASLYAWLRRPSRLEIQPSVLLVEADEDALMAEGYREFADEMLELAQQSRAVQLRSLASE